MDDEDRSPWRLDELLLIVFAVSYLTAWALTPAGVL